MQVPWKQQIWLKRRGRTIRPRCFFPRSQVCEVLQNLWATATHQPPRPRKLCWDLHSILFFLPYRVGSASQHPSCPPTHMQLGAWTGTLGAGILAKSWTLGINPDPQGHFLGSSERADGWYLSQAPCDCVMLSCMGRSLSHNPRAHTQQWKDLFMLCQETSTSLLSVPGSTGPMARGPSSCILKKHTAGSSSSFHSHPLGSMGFSLYLYQCVLEVVCGSEHSH